MKGHTNSPLQIFEKSSFAAEIGAALGLTPNGTRVLRELGFSFDRARARPMPLWDVVDGTSLARLISLDFSNAELRFGGPTFGVHRVDMHNELLRLALDGQEATSVLRLSSRVVSCDAEEGIVTLADGSTHTADLIVGADGVHSVLRDVVVDDGKVSAPTPTGLSAFRFLISTEVLTADEKLVELLKWKTPGATTLGDSRVAASGQKVQERHMIWYDCQE